MSDTSTLHINDILTPVIKRSQNFLKEDMGIECHPAPVAITNPEKLQLRYITALIGAGGPLNVIFGISYDEELIRKLLVIFAECEIEPEEEEEYLHSVACEIINIIIGNAIADFPKIADIITITPPFVIAEAKTISKHKNAKIWTSDIQTDYGGFSVNYIAPRELFTDDLEYKE